MQPTITTYHPRCEVTIYTPADVSSDGEVFGPPSSGARIDPMRDLLTVETNQQMGNCGGTFSLQFAPRDVRPGTSWADVLPLYSVVVIKFERKPYDDSPKIEMIGLVESVGESGNFGSAQPVRGIRVSGRSAASALLNGHPVQFFPLTSGDPSLQYDVNTYVGAMFDEKLFRDALNKPPQNAIYDIFSKYVSSIDISIPRFTEKPVQFTSPEGVLDASATSAGLNLIRFDLSKTSLYDASARYTVPVPYRYGGFIWSILAGFVDAHFQEFFTLQDPDEERTDIVFRALPFKRVTDILDFKSIHRFHGLIDTNAPHMTTVTALPSDCVAEPNWHRGVADIYTAYRVMPPSALASDLAFASSVPAVIDGNPLSPTYFKRFGLKLLEVKALYFPLSMDGVRVDDSASGPPDLFHAKAKEWSELLRDWHRPAPLFYDGTVHLKGQTAHRVGQRFLMLRDPRALYPYREAYIVGVTKNFEVQSSSFLSTLTLTRGFDLFRGAEL